MAATLNQISSALAARLASITGLRDEADVPMATKLPAAIVEGFESGRRSTMAGCWVWRIPITVYVARLNERSASQKAKALASPGAGGIWDALEDESVDDACDYVTVLEVRDFGEYEANDLTLLGFQILVEVGA